MSASDEDSEACSRKREASAAVMLVGWVGGAGVVGAGVPGLGLGVPPPGPGAGGAGVPGLGGVPPPGPG